MFYPARWKKINVNQSKVLKIDFSVFFFFWGGGGGGHMAAIILSSAVKHENIPNKMVSKE